MCGRFTLTSPASALAALFDVEPPSDLRPRYNIAPAQDVLAVRRRATGEPREAVWLRWGLIPSWTKDPTIGNRLINARAETAADKPSFRSAMRRRRCLIAADGFFEWSAVEGGPKRPHRITLEPERPFAFAGLWERWRPPDGLPIESCTILTTRANGLLARIHARMPVILSRQDHERWLDTPVDRGTLPVDLLRPYPAEQMKYYPVSARVNSPRHDDADCIAPADPDAGIDQPRLPLQPDDGGGA